MAPGTESAAEQLTEQQMVQAEIDVVQLDVMAVINDITSHAPRTQLRQDLQALDTAIGDLVRAEINFFKDNHMFFLASTDQGGELDPTRGPVVIRDPVCCSVAVSMTAIPSPWESATNSFESSAVKASPYV